MLMLKVSAKLLSVITIWFITNFPLFRILKAVWLFVPGMAMAYNVFDEKFNSTQSDVTDKFDLHGRCRPLGSFF